MGASVDLAAAATIVDEALAHGRQLGCSPLTVVVLDAGGHPVALKREDRSGIMRTEIAMGKAWGALGMRLPSRDLQRRAELMPRFIDALAAASSGRLIPVAGGVLIRSEGDVIGAVGVSGDVSDRDEACAVHGILAAGLEADTESTEPW
jgi:uncharacterized protein GlcG (DUF336 family)